MITIPYSLGTHLGWTTAPFEHELLRCLEDLTIVIALTTEELFSWVSSIKHTKYTLRWKYDERARHSRSANVQSAINLRLCGSRFCPWPFFIHCRHHQWSQLICQYLNVICLCTFSIKIVLCDDVELKIKKQNECNWHTVSEPCINIFKRVPCNRYK